MSADELLRAVTEIRKEQEREENLGHIDGRTYAAWLHVATWLEREGRRAQVNFGDPIDDAALAVARAYMGGAA